MNYETERRVAMDAVAAACRLCRRVRDGSGPAGALTKEDRSPATVADFGSQALVVRTLREPFPAARIVAEEDAAELRQSRNAAVLSEVCDRVRELRPGLRTAEILDAIDGGSDAGGAEGRFWALDPIDGTKGFIRGGQYAVALALVDDGKVVLGVLGCPNLPVDPTDADGATGCLFVGSRGEGAFVLGLDGGTPVPAQTHRIPGPEAASVCESVESAHSSHGDSSQIAARLGVRTPPLRIDSQCKYAAVARGDAHIYLRLPTKPGYREKIWDHAAGYLIVEEAGGRVTDVAGRRLDFSLGRTLRENRGVVATCGTIHDRTLAAVESVLSPPTG